MQHKRLIRIINIGSTPTIFCEPFFVSPTKPLPHSNSFHLIWVWFALHPNAIVRSAHLAGLHSGGLEEYGSSL